MTVPKREQRTHLEPDVAAAIARRFDGDAALYRTFAADCAVQFGLDAAAGQRACAAGDLVGLRRLAHDLRSALVMLGHERIGGLAARVEAHAAAGDLASARMSWRRLRSALLGLNAR